MIELLNKIDTRIADVILILIIAYSFIVTIFAYFHKRMVNEYREDINNTSELRLKEISEELERLKTQEATNT